MDQTLRLLQALVENGRMGEDACKQLLELTPDADMRAELERERMCYARAVGAAEEMLSSRGVTPRPKGPMARAGLWMGMQINTATDRSASHIADIVIQGATMGVVELTKARNSNSEADARAQDIAAYLIARQQEAIERLKSFLREKTVVK